MPGSCSGSRLELENGGSFGEATTAIIPGHDSEHIHPSIQTLGNRTVLVAQGNPVSAGRTSVGGEDRTRMRFFSSATCTNEIILHGGRETGLRASQATREPRATTSGQIMLCT